jgi:hypothetical protein
MVPKSVKKDLFALSLTVLSALIPFASAHAVPSFARQTGMSCNACHTLWPELTPFGRTFKLDGYTMSKSSPSEPFHVPLSAMIQLSYTSLDKNSGILKNGIAPFDNAADSMVDKTNLPQQASIFYAGRIMDHLGAFAQLTYDGTANDVALDNTDIRYARTTILGSKHLVYGFTLNNSPSVRGDWNTVPVWSFPYASSAVAPTPAASTVIDGGLDQQVGGIGAYADWGDWVYLGASVYRTTNDGITRPLGAGTTTTTVTDGAVPYWRLALHHSFGKHSFELGTFGIKADIFPSGLTDGPTDSFKDYAFDAQYQFVGPPHIFTLHASWTHEDQDWDASFPLALTANPSTKLESFKANAGYFYRSSFGTLGGIVGFFATTGDSDTVLYSLNPVDGSRTGSPDSRGFILEANYLFREKYKFSAQYTIYSKFNGSDSNYDGFGRDASGNNTLYLLAWLMF